MFSVILLYANKIFAVISILITSKHSLQRHDKLLRDYDFFEKINIPVMDNRRNE